jgi:hypothetical protein
VHAQIEDKSDAKKSSFYEELDRVFDQFPKCHVQILSGDFNEKVGREDIFKQTIRNESLHEISIDNGVRVVNFATSKNLSRVHCSHIATLINITELLLGKWHNHADRVLTDKKKSNVVDILYYRDSDRESDHYLDVAKVRDRMSVTERETQKLFGEISSQDAK